MLNRQRPAFPDVWRCCGGGTDAGHAPWCRDVPVTNPVQHRSAALRFVIFLALVAGCCFAIASGIAVVAAWQIEMITRSHRVVLEKMEHVTER